MSYARPAHNAADASWVGQSAYTRPSHNSADAAFSEGVPSGIIVAPSPLGVPSLYGSATASVSGPLAVPGPLGAPVVVAAHVCAGRVAAASLLGMPALQGVVVPLGRAAAPSPLAVPRLVGTVVRYELRGEVRDQGVLVERRVRAHHRDTGALAAEGDTAIGAFVIPVGFVAAEYYLVPINLDPAATDFAPPCANRVTSVLAMD